MPHKHTHNILLIPCLHVWDCDQTTAHFSGRVSWTFYGIKQLAFYVCFLSPLLKPTNKTKSQDLPPQFVSHNITASDWKRFASAKKERKKRNTVMSPPLQSLFCALVLSIFIILLRWQHGSFVKKNLSTSHEWSLTEHIKHVFFTTETVGSLNTVLQ